MNKDYFNLGTFRIVPTIGKNPWATQTAYKHSEYVEQGLPTMPEAEEPAEFDCSDALAVIANIKAKL